MLLLDGAREHQNLARTGRLEPEAIPRGFDTREGWPGWDRVRAMMPEAEIGELIVELRSATAGAGSFTRAFDRMAEVTGRAADQIIAAHRVAA